MVQRRRLFSLAEALDLLPAVRRMVIDLQERTRDLEARTNRFDRMLATTTGNGDLEQDLAEARRETERTALEAQKLFGELDGLGVELKDIDAGLVDFPSEREGHTVYLCWRLGEETISYWHETDVGYLGRKLL